MKRSGITAIEICIIVAIIAIIAAIVIPALSSKSTPIQVNTAHREYEGWTWVTASPWGNLYMKHLPEKHITVYWDTHNGNMQVVNDRD